jgi:hypothetical protein
VLGAEELAHPPPGQVLDLVDDLVAAVVPLPREYLLVSTDPVAAITAGDVKFSEAMSCSVVFCRSSSRSSIEKISVSSEVRVVVSSRTPPV